MNAPTPALSLPELTNHIANLEQEKSRLSLPSLSELENRIQYHSARTHLTDKQEAAGHVASLQGLLESKRLAEVAWQRNGEIVRELALLKQELHFAEHEQQVARAQVATKELQSAIDEFATQAKACVRAYRRCQRIAARNAATGGQTRIPFDMSLMFLSSNPYSGFTLQQEMGFGPLPFEIREKEQQP